MKLGLVCISEILHTTEKLHARAMTRKKFLTENRQDSIKELSARILINTQVFQRTLEQCVDLCISHYRVSSSMFPLVTDETLSLDYSDLPDITEIQDNLTAAGNYARSNYISLSTHPDQFNVLASLNEDTVRRSIRQLNHEAQVMDWIGLPQNYDAPMCLHLNRGPKGEETPDEYRSLFLKNFSECSDGVQNRLVLENEDKGFWNCENLYSAFNAYIPLVFDNLHDACNPSPLDGEEWARLFAETWGDYTPVFHWSEGIDGSSKHANYFTHVPKVVSDNSGWIWECEVKSKDLAIRQVLNGELV